jgi:hypothetical protein
MSSNGLSSKVVIFDIPKPNQKLQKEEKVQIFLSNIYFKAN